MPCMMLKSGQCGLCNGIDYFYPACPRGASELAEAKNPQTPAQDTTPSTPVVCPRCGWKIYPKLEEPDEDDDFDED